MQICYYNFMGENTDIASQLGKLGGEKTKQKYGTNHFKKIAEKRWAKYREDKKQNEKQG